jgi:hypothetical protein
MLPFPSQKSFARDGTTPVEMGDQRFLDWERALAAEKSAKAVGSASVELDFQHDDDEKNTNRLKSFFKKGGHCRLDIRNHILAVIDPHSLDAALRASGLSADMLLDNPQGTYKQLNFPPGVRLHCLHGLDRARAAAQSLPPGDRRWVVDLFLGGGVTPLNLAMCRDC